MACPKLVIWNVPEGSRFCAQASAQNGAAPSDDYNAGIVIAQPDGSETDWAKSDLDPGPACLSLQKGGYGASGELDSGPAGPTVTLHAWIEPPVPDADCTWSNSGGAGSVYRPAITIVVK